MSAFFAGTKESAKDVAIWITSKRNNRWTDPTIIADGVISDTLRYACWNPVLFRSASDEIFLFYKVGPNPREWWGMFRISHDEGKSWSKPERLADGLIGPVKNKPVQLKDGTILSPSSIETEDTWKVHIEKSIDGGQSWQIIKVDSQSTFRAIQPSILEHGGDTLQVICRSNQDSLVTAWSYDNGDSWTNLKKLPVRNPNSGTDAVTLKDGSFMLVYNPTIRGENWWNNRGKLNVAISSDGVQWKDVLILENGKKEEYSYPAIIQTQDGKVHITYTHDRKNVKHVGLVRMN